MEYDETRNHEMQFISINKLPNTHSFTSHSIKYPLVFILPWQYVYFWLFSITTSKKYYICIKIIQLHAGTLYEIAIHLIIDD